MAWWSFGFFFPSFYLVLVLGTAHTKDWITEADTGDTTSGQDSDSGTQDIN